VAAGAGAVFSVAAGGFSLHPAMSANSRIGPMKRVAMRGLSSILLSIQVLFVCRRRWREEFEIGDGEDDDLA